MKLNNGIEMEIRRSWYNKSQVQDDGITHIIDAEHQYPVYQFGIAKNYFDIEDREEVVRAIIKDLRQTIVELGDLLQHVEKETEQEER